METFPSSFAKLYSCPADVLANDAPADLPISNNNDFFVFILRDLSNIFYQNATKKCCILIATELIRGPYARDFIKNIAIFSDNKKIMFL